MLKADLLVKSLFCLTLCSPLLFLYPSILSLLAVLPLSDSDYLKLCSWPFVTPYDPVVTLRAS
jgi:hypothetical protein